MRNRPAEAVSSSRWAASPASRSGSPSPTPSAICTTPTPAGCKTSIPVRRRPSRSPGAMPRRGRTGGSHESRRGRYGPARYGPMGDRGGHGAGPVDIRGRVVRRDAGGRAERRGLAVPVVLHHAARDTGHGRLQGAVAGRVARRGVHRHRRGLRGGHGRGRHSHLEDREQVHLEDQGPGRAAGDGRDVPRGHRGTRPGPAPLHQERAPSASGRHRQSARRPGAERSRTALLLRGRGARPDGSPCGQVHRYRRPTGAAGPRGCAADLQQVRRLHRHPGRTHPYRHRVDVRPAGHRPHSPGDVVGHAGRLPDHRGCPPSGRALRRLRQRRRVEEGLLDLRGPEHAHRAVPGRGARQGIRHRPARLARRPRRPHPGRPVAGRRHARHGRPAPGHRARRCRDP